MTEPLRDPPGRLLRLAACGPTLVALAGVPGSGKTTCAQAWVAEANRRAGEVVASALGMDGFHLPRANLDLMPDPAEAHRRRGAPWTFDPSALARALHELKALGSTAWPSFDHAVGDPTPGRAVGTRVVLVEGLYLLLREGPWAAVADAFDEHWFLDVDPTLARARLLARHQRVWGMTLEQAEARAAANDDLNAHVVLSSLPHANCRIRPSA